MYSANEANPSFNHKSSHQFIVTKLPNHWTHKRGEKRGLIIEEKKKTTSSIIDSDGIKSRSGRYLVGQFVRYDENDALFSSRRRRVIVHQEGTFTKDDETPVLHCPCKKGKRKRTLRRPFCKLKRRRMRKEVDAVPVPALKSGTETRSSFGNG